MILLSQREVPVKRGSEETRLLTNAEIARRLGVHKRTVQRWRNDGAQPSARSRKAVRRLTREYEREVKTLRKDATRDRKRHPKAMKARQLPEVVRGTRRKIKERDRKGRATGRMVESSWINYSVAGWSFARVLKLLEALRRAGRAVQLIYELPAGARYPVGRNGKAPGLKASRKTRSASAITALWTVPDQASLASWLMQTMPMEPGSKSLKMLYVAVDDYTPGKR